ncbi:hypothetical protein EW145_g4221 [Phellinidium pouzarii]|uniref:Myosin-binding domain-containing protein n=1 Tax=Phellinidium pouzarii TaxID=167371 RepID=A0A4S4L4T0_9AGAM|nr:hypothetical protein EW145_g4221 [Phellinidium pouzarii]
MAQALYNEHPLDDYLRHVCCKEAGDEPERIPGAFTGGTDEYSEDLTVSCVDLAPLPSSELQRWTSSIQNIFPSPVDDFAERFKYDLISSNLLSSSVSSSPVVNHARLRVPSPECHLPGEMAIQPDAVEKSDQEFKSFTSAFILVGLAALMNQFTIAALIALTASFSLAKSRGATSAKQSYIPQVFESLENLKFSGSAWDAAVNDAITIIEGEERSSYYTPSSSASPTPLSALRISLHSTLLTTQHQCDNVRPLLAALASPSELSQLSEMYAPPSPVKPPLSLQSRPSAPSRRRVSLSENAISTSPSPQSSTSEKRQTWNGSNISGVDARTSSVLRKRDRRRSDMFALLDAQSPTRSSAVMRSTPPSPALTQVPEADEEEEEQDSLIDIPIDERDLSKDNFGTAALFLRRKRRASGAEALGLSFSRSDPSLRNSAHLSLPSSISSPRFTSFTTSRSPLSFSALQHALQGALASRRYACAHLLALRFNEDADDECYWENVRSVTALLVSTLDDSAARLNDALIEADNLSKQDGQPTPEASPEVKSKDELQDNFSPQADNGSPSRLFKLSSPSTLLISPSPSDGKSFAPTPDIITRFAAHVDAISSSLSDSKGHMLECVEGLQNVQRCVDFSPSSQGQREAQEAEEASVQSYDRLRRELGHALRECERGRLALMDIFEARRKRIQLLNEPAEEEQDDDAPSFGHLRRQATSASSRDSCDKGDLGPLTPEEGSPVVPRLPLLDENASANTIAQALDQDMDDVTQHLLLSASSSHLPPAGIEQVFEADSAAITAFTRERSKLSREERISLMKRKRDSMNGRGLAAHLEEDDERATRLGWGPGTEVVEELKDVIWKVGERRRKMMSDTLKTNAASISSVSVPESSGGPDDYDTSLCTS